VPAAAATALSAHPDRDRAARDPIERLAVDRARAAFGATYADVRPRSGDEARTAVLSVLLRSDDVVLDARLNAHPRQSGWAHTHRTVEHLPTADDQFDHEGLEELARRVRPAVLFCGGEPHPLTPDFQRLRRIADAAGALLVADISHVAGFAVTGLLPNPVDHAHVTISCTATHLPGIRGGLVLSGRDAALPVRGATLADVLATDAAPDMAVVAGTARVLDIVRTESYRDQVWRGALVAAEMAAEFILLGHRVLTGGTDNHLVLVELTHAGGQFAANALREVNIVVGRVPGRDAVIALDLTPAVQRGLGRSEARRVAQLVDEALRGVHARDDGYRLEPFTRLSVRDAVMRLLWQFPLPRHIPTTRWRNTP